MVWFAPKMNGMPTWPNPCRTQYGEHDGHNAHEEYEGIMGQTPPPPPQYQRFLPPAPHPVPLDLACNGHREAWSRYEAEREYEAWQTGEDYAPTPVSDLRLCNREITQINESLRKQPRPIPEPIPGDWK